MVGRLADPADPEAIAGALSLLAGDAALRDRLIAAGRERVALFSGSAAARATLAVYREALAEGDGGARSASGGSCGSGP